MHDLFLHVGFQMSEALNVSREVEVLFSQKEMASSYSCHFVTTFYGHAGRNLLFEHREIPLTVEFPAVASCSLNWTQFMLVLFSMG